MGCTALDSVRYSEGLVSIGEDAFAGTALNGSITLPSTVTTVGTSAFAQCGDDLYVTLADGTRVN